ncbi:hypothetical protein WJX81_006144 [Elliptochloris bilobata]|uniref:WAT1-related protein n=1 Tax=Elliptochloris bilobata TaxID=381761 RepID=A0AAW1SIT0_9CHLO
MGVHQRATDAESDSDTAIIIAADSTHACATPEKKEGQLGTTVKPWHCQVALAGTQLAFCVGSVYLKNNLRSLDHGQVFHPIIYALAREAIAAPIMCGIAYSSTRQLPARKDLLRVAALGLCLYFNQLFYIIGIDLSGVVVATCMQPTIPVFTAAIAVALHLEAGSAQKFAGIGLAVGGSICMVLGGVGGHHSPAEGRNMGLGNLCLLLNTLAMALYYLTAKQLVGQYPAMCIAAWAYITAAIAMGATAVLFVERAGWEVPPALAGPLAYWIVVCSVLGYYVVTWATQYLPASQVASFQCLQPFVGTLLAFAVLGEEPSVWDLGAIGVLVGLVLVVSDKHDLQAGSAALVGSLRRILSQQLLAMKAAPAAAAAISLKGRPRTHKGGGKGDKAPKPMKPKRDELPP